MAGLGRAQAERQGYYDNQLRQLLANPTAIYDDPGYKAAFDQGTQAVARSMAANGFIGSGNAAVELQRFGQSFALDYARQRQSLLASMAGGNFNPAQAMSAGFNADTTAWQQLGSSLANLGYTFGAQNAGGSGFPESGFGASTSVPGTMDMGGGYIVNVPGS